MAATTSVPMVQVVIRPVPSLRGVIRGDVATPGVPTIASSMGVIIPSYASATYVRPWPVA